MTFEYLAGMIDEVVTEEDRRNVQYCIEKELDPYIEREAWDWGENHPDVLRHKEARKFWASVAERLKK